MKYIPLVLIGILLADIARAQTVWTGRQRRVQQTVVKTFDALSMRDSVGLRLYCAEDIRLFEYGSVWNLDTLIRKAIILNTAEDFTRVNTLDFINTVARRKTAWASYQLQSVINSDGRKSTVQWIETVVLVKRKGNWKIKVLHSSLVRRL